MKNTVKAIVSVLLIAVNVFASVSVAKAADGYAYQAYVQQRFKHIVKVSYDEVRYGFKPNGSDEKQHIFCSGRYENIDTPHLPQGTQSAIFWGWIAANGSDIESFSYVQEGKYTLSLDKFKIAPEPAVTANSPGEFVYRFKVIVPVDPAGIRTVQLFANFADGTKEEFWRAKVYIPPFDESTFVDPLAEDILKGDINGDSKVNNKDVVALFRYVNGINVNIDTDTVDFNEDGKINNKDVVALFRYVSGNITPPDDTKWTDADMYDKSDYDSKVAKRLKTGEDFAEHFAVNAKFKSISVWCPSWGNDTGSIRISLYKYDGSVLSSINGAVIATKLFTDYADNSWLKLSFAEQNPGEYVVTLTDPTEYVGVWLYPSNVSKSLFYVNGAQTSAEMAMTIQVKDGTEPLFEQVASGADQPVEPILTERDAMPDTWAATDGLGRTLPVNAETGDLKKDKYVGMFYWTWHVMHAQNYSPINLQDICDQYPEAITNHNHSVWNNIANYYGCFWNEPIYGYYTTTDRWVLRKHAELLADAGVDVIIFDNTNGTFTWRDSYNVLFEVFQKARQDGVKTPQISFLLPFSNAEDAATQLRTIYQDVYKDGKYSDLWFYWDGKPLIMSPNSGLNRSNALDNEIYSFFTYRQGVAQYNAYSQSNTTNWGWLAKHPQAVYTDRTGKKQTTVGVAQNWSSEMGLAAMNGSGIFGRTYTSKGYDTRENAKLYGANFAEQWEYAISKNVDFVFVTGWNEWIAQKQPTWQGTVNAFPDEFNDEYSRDIEPTKGDLKDHYYYQLVSYIRKFKGARAVPEPTEEKTLNINGSISQWDNVGPYYISYIGNTFDRSSKGYVGKYYTNTTGRNDIIGAKVARDSDNLYFMAECNDDITPYTDKAWMRLFIDTGTSDKSWEGFEYVLNRVSPSSTQATLEQSTGGWNFSTVGKVSYKVNGKYLTVKIPKVYLGITTDKFTVNFKWNDNMQKDGDIMDFYSNGDTAPGGRFMYSYVVK